jgi:anti-sigma regulatory factor (Ser/Thr protein kinase)
MQLAFDLSLPADKKLLAVTRQVVRLYLREFGTPGDVIDDVVLAMDEACSNVVEHAFPQRADSNYRLRADLGAGKILIEVLDDGIGFDVMAKPRPRPDEDSLATGGRGLEVMRRLMTTVEVESPTATGGTRLRLVRVLPPTGH